MKKSITCLALVLAAVLLTGCAGTAVVYYGECTCPAGGHTAAPAESIPTEGAVRTGVAIVASATGSAAGDADGEIKYDVTLAAVTVDDHGVITGCIIDSIGTSVLFDASGMLRSDLTAPLLTKNELGDSYNMKLYGGAVAEWYEQAAALASFAVGKTVAELRAGAVSETGHAVDADLATSATIYLGGYVDAIEKAVASAEHLGAQAGDELRLAIIPKVDSSKSADGENAGLAQLDVDAAAVTMNGGVITSAQIDSLQAKVHFDAAGAVTTDLSGAFRTKNELGEQYGMAAWGGAIAEWDQQAAAFAAYITGKTPAEVAGIAVSQEGKPTDADLASSVTIAIGGFQELIWKVSDR